MIGLVEHTCRLHLGLKRISVPSEDRKNQPCLTTQTEFFRCSSVLKYFTLRLPSLKSLVVKSKWGVLYKTKPSAIGTSLTNQSIKANEEFSKPCYTHVCSGSGPTHWFLGPIFHSRNHQGGSSRIIGRSVLPEKRVWVARQEPTPCTLCLWLVAFM